MSFFNQYLLIALACKVGFGESIHFGQVLTKVRDILRFAGSLLRDWNGP